MPVLSFEHPPPPRKVLTDLSSPPKIAPKITQLHDIKSTSALVQDMEPTLPNNAYPVVKLDVDVISEATASRLAASLLGHVLFLKNQIPFPVMQLGRLPGGKTNSRAAKLRTELMVSYDTISSHLDTTFSALATALARCSGPEVPSSMSQAHVAILVGPSLGSAKAKVIMGINGLEKKIWGLRSAAISSENAYESEDEVEEENEEEADEDEGSVDVGSEDEGEEVPEDSDNEEEDVEESRDEGADEDADDENAEGEEDGEADEADGDDETDSAPPPPYISYAEEQKFLQSADRLLSRVLAAADAEGNGITSEMSPTQTHILIRAPRVFKHPAWIPRQNVSAPLDATLADFFSASGVQCPDLPAHSAKQISTKKSKVEGVWITTRGGINAHPNPEATVQHGEKKDGAKNQGNLHLPTLTDEDAEMIWWSWDGKFVGFSDW